MTMKKEKWMRTCSECGKPMAKGYVVWGGDEYYCSDKCLHKHYSAEEWEEMSAAEEDPFDDYDEEEGNDENYWTEWGSGDEIDESTGEQHMIRKHTHKSSILEALRGRKRSKKVCKGKECKGDECKEESCKKNEAYDDVEVDDELLLGDGEGEEELDLDDEMLLGENKIERDFTKLVESYMEDTGDLDDEDTEDKLDDDDEETEDPNEKKAESEKKTVKRDVVGEGRKFRRRMDEKSFLKNTFDHIRKGVPFSQPLDDDEDDVDDSDDAWGLRAARREKRAEYARRHSGDVKRVAESHKRDLRRERMMRESRMRSRFNRKRFGR